MIDDPYAWLEELDSERALAWVRAQNDISTAQLSANPEFDALRQRLLAVYNSEARIPFVSKAGAYFYNFWRDATHVRGVWRRTTLAEYRAPEPKWQTVLDLDRLAEQEQENWVWAGASFLHGSWDRCLIMLSRGGGDSHVVREFDVTRLAFVSDGFNLPEAKSDVAFRDRDHLFVATDFGPGSLTSSGYPRIVKSWQRGTPLTAASTIYEGEPDEVGVGFEVFDHDGVHRELVARIITFRRQQVFALEAGALIKLDVPEDASASCFRDRLVVTLRSELRAGDKVYPSGAVLAIAWDRFRDGARDFDVLFAPSPRSSLAGMTHTRHDLILDLVDNVHNTLEAHTWDGASWKRAELAAPELGSAWAMAIDPDASDDYFMWSAGFLTPDSLFLSRIGASQPELLKRLPPFFDARGLEVTQHSVRSRDGAEIPYFMVARRGLAHDASHRTLLTAYGGFQVSNTPSYSGGLGLGWLERGGVYVLANIRGGGEFGPSWHQAALQQHRQRAFDDFIAVAEGLIARKVTQPKHLGIMGGSNGGLLVGVAMTQRPDLFGAVVCQVPLLDMRRYHKLLAGASWIAEYGDPDEPAAWEYISKYSPYHNVQTDKRYPRVLFTTSTRDDRVHPAHARKMAAKLSAANQDVLLYENIEGGHGGAANNAQQAFMSALAYTFLWQSL
jgi:prolyl oligopeptidase